MAKYKKHEIEMSEHLLKKLFEYVRDPKVQPTDIEWIVGNIVELSKCDEMLTLDEFERITKKYMTV